MNFWFTLAKPVLDRELFRCIVFVFVRCPVLVIVIKFISVLISCVCVYQHYHRIFVCLSSLEWRPFPSSLAQSHTCCSPSLPRVSRNPFLSSLSFPKFLLSTSKSFNLLGVIISLYIHAICLTCLYD